MNRARLLGTRCSRVLSATVESVGLPGKAHAGTSERSCETPRATVKTAMTIGSNGVRERSAENRIMMSNFGVTTSEQRVDGEPAGSHKNKSHARAEEQEFELKTRKTFLQLH